MNVRIFITPGDRYDGRPVPIISFASTKGGVGKTTLAFVVATAIARRLASASDYCVACIDADPNGTLDAALRKTGNPDIWSLASRRRDVVAQAAGSAARRGGGTDRPRGVGKPGNAVHLRKI